MKWTEQEKQYLIDNFNSKKIKEIAVFLNKNEKTVASMCRSLNLKKEFRSYATKHSSDKNHPLYQKWVGLKKRQKDKICQEWKNSYDSFFNWAISQTDDFTLYLDLIDENGIYEPSNCTFSKRSKLHKKADQSLIGKSIINEDNKEKILEKIKKTNLEKYGVETPFQSEEIKEKIKKTNLEKYGFELASQSELVKENTKKNNLEKYGVEYPQQLEEYKNKLIEDNIEKYGVKSTLQLPEVKEKCKKTSLEKYGVENYSSTKECREKVAKTNMEKYGYQYVWCSPEIKEKIKKTMMERYGTLVPKRNLSEQKSVSDFLNSLGIETKGNVDVLKTKEIDIYSENHKIGIEYCGIYWHSEEYDRYKYSHYDKYKECKDLGIRLITIFSDEWISRRKQVKNYLRSCFGKLENKIMARKCKVIEISKKIGRDFIEDNHIQGQKKFAKKYFGLEYNGKLVFVMCFSTHHRQNSSKTDIVLSRMCSIENTNIVGAASKILSVAEKWAKENGYKRIISWSDNRWSNGNVYEKIGFQKSRDLVPDFSWTSNKIKNKRISKQTMKNIIRTQKIKKTSLEEKGLYKIWDCGKILWVKDL